MSLTPTKKRVLRMVWKYFLIFLGSALLALGDAAFLVPFNLVTGGVVSIGIIAQYYVTLSGSTFQVTDIITWGIQIAMLGVSFAFLGKRFTARTIASVLLYPALFTLMLRIPVGGYEGIGPAIAAEIRREIGNELIAGDILAAVFGGACVGGGVGICYLAGGSTGGLDVISAILAIKVHVKESVSAFLMDTFILLVGLACMQNLVRALIGVVSALICALMVQYLFVRTNVFIVADIVSDQADKIREYVENTMDRTTTLITAQGGYTGETRTIIRVAFSKKELIAFKSFIAEVDPKAFVTFTEASMINGEGFAPLKPSVLGKITENRLDNETHFGDKK